MRLNKIFIAAIAATAIFASCSKEGIDTTTVEGKKATINLSITTPDSKAKDASAPSDVITDYVAFIFNSVGTLETATPIVSTTAAPQTGINVTTNASQIYVVANITPTEMNSITTKAALEGYIADLNANGSQTAKRWASGKATITFTQSGDNFVASVNVPLTFVSARIVLTIDNGMTGYNPAAVDGSLVLKNVAVINAGGATKLFAKTGTSLIPTASEYAAASYVGKKKYSGIANNDFENWVDDSGVNTPFLIDPIASNDFDSKYIYYVFENSASTLEGCPTIVTIIGTYGGKTIYFPVHLAPYESWTAGSASVNSVTRGNSYNINIRLTGDPTFPNGNPGGDDDPTTPTVTATVSATISLTDWNPVVLNKEF